MNEKFEHDAQHDSKRETHGRAAFESNDPGTVQNAMRHRRRQVRECGDRCFEAGWHFRKKRCGSRNDRELVRKRNLLGADNRAIDWANVAVAGSRLPGEAVVFGQRRMRVGRCMALTAGANGVLIGGRKFALGAVRRAGVASRAVCRRGKNQRDRKENRTGAADRKRWMGGGSQHA